LLPRGNALALSWGVLCLSASLFRFTLSLWRERASLPWPQPSQPTQL
jgi:hypothetical protein